MRKDIYESPLSSRYASEYMLHLFSPDMRFQTWRRLWVALARAEHELGLPITQEQVDELRAHVDDIDYACKSTDRSALNRLFARRGAYDDILIVRRHLLTDTSIANIALFDGSHWHTPQHPLLKGTKRAELLDKGILTEKDIRMEELPAYSTIRLFNAMIDWGEAELPTDCLHPVF